MGGRTQTNSQMAVPAPKFLLTLPQVGREGMSWQTRAEHYLYDHIYIYIYVCFYVVFSIPLFVWRCNPKQLSPLP